MKTEVIGISLSNNVSEYTMYRVEEDRKNALVISGMTCIASYLFSPDRNFDKTQFVIVCDASCTEREDKIGPVLASIKDIKKNCLTPVLVVIGDDKPPLSEKLKSQCIFRNVKFGEDDRLQALEYIVHEELETDRKSYNPSAVNSDYNAVGESRSHDFSLALLGGFITALGILAVALAFTVLNAATLGVAGLVTAGLGVVAVVTGIGFFASAVSRKTKDEPTSLVNDSLSFASLAR